MISKGCIYLIPNNLGEDNNNRLFPSFNTSVIEELQYFIVENIRTARRFIRSLSKTKDIDSLVFFTLNQHTNQSEISSFLKPLEEGYSIGIISEAGCPGIADPGADVVAIAHEKNYIIVPLIGPSSIFLALMASGMNGQNFAFNGYLPIKEDRIKAIKNFESMVFTRNQSQIFIETPYRNEKLFSDILSNCNGSTKLCIACNIATSEEFIKTLSINNWKKEKIEIDKKPTIFILGK